MNKTWDAIGDTLTASFGALQIDEKIDKNVKSMSEEEFYKRGKKIADENVKIRLKMNGDNMRLYIYDDKGNINETWRTTIKPAKNPEKIREQHSGFLNALIKNYMRLELKNRFDASK